LIFGLLTFDYTFKVDVWSSGCVVIEMLSGQPPWAEQNFENPFRALYHIGHTDNLPRIPEVSDVGRQFVLSCLTRDPDQRPTAEQLLEHDWLHFED
jgi:serine/threonine protein kinase